MNTDMLTLLKDEELYNILINKNSEEALIILMKRHKEGLILFINGYVHNINNAEELMLDTFAEIAAGPTLFSHRSSFKTWLFSVAKNITLMHLRKENKYISLSDDNKMDCYESSSATPELDILKNERNRQLYLALDKINPDYRQILILLYFEDMSHDEAAIIMKKSKKQIYHLAERGRKSLKLQLDKMGFTLDN